MTTQLDAMFLQRLKNELSKVLMEFSEAPSGTGLLEVAAVAELVSVNQDSVYARDLCAIIRSHVKQWIERGLLQDLLFAEPDYAYQTALLVAFVPIHSVEGLSQLWKSGLIGRTEWPMLQQVIITSILAQGDHSGISKLLENASHWFDLGQLSLRSSHDERDIDALMQLAQVFKVRVSGAGEFHRSQGKSRMLCRELLALNLRRDDLNRVSILAYLGACLFECPDFLLTAARVALTSSSVCWDSFTPLQEYPPESKHEAGLTVRASTLRSALAWPLFLSTPKGSTSDEDSRASFPYASSSD